MRIPTIALGVALALLAGPGGSVAPHRAVASEGERVLSISGAYATFTIPDHTTHGGAGGIDFARGLSDTFSVRVSGSGGVYSEDGLAWSGMAAVGLDYVFDVIKYVPYLNLGFGAIVIGGDALETEVKPVLEMGAGVEFLRGRDRSWGVVVRLYSAASDITVFTAAVRTSWRWGFF
jgi:hypothetical protein